MTVALTLMHTWQILTKTAFRFQLIQISIARWTKFQCQNSGQQGIKGRGERGGREGGGGEEEEQEEDHGKEEEGGGEKDGKDDEEEAGEKERKEKKTEEENGTW